MEQVGRRKGVEKVCFEKPLQWLLQADLLGAKLHLLIAPQAPFGKAALEGALTHLKGLTEPT